MKRRIQNSRVAATVLLAAPLTGAFAGDQEKSQDASELRNIVVIISDDHALHVTGTYGNSIIRTPHIDRLADESVTFTEAYCNSPICSASRQSLLTGKLPHATGVNLLFTPFQDEGNITIAEHLKENGYQTGLFGKTHFNNWVWHSLYTNGLPQHGFDTLISRKDYRSYFKAQEMPSLPKDMEFYDFQKSKAIVTESMNWRNLPHPVYDEYSEGTFYANQAIEFMKENRDQPFIAWVAFKEPHHPFYFPIEYAGKYDPADMPLPEGSPEDDRWVPEKYRNFSEEERRGVIASYYTSTEYMDKNVGRVLAALDDLKLTENTLVIYLSDNGYLLNDHKRFEKHTMWQEAVHQPMILRPGAPLSRPRRSAAMIEFIDLVPTLLELTGVQPLDEVQGKSFAHLLKNRNAAHREAVFSEYLEDNLAMIKTAEWKYVFTTGRRDLGINYQTGYGPSGIIHRLYNLKKDPGEQTDVSKKPKNQKTLEEMQLMMLQRFVETHPDAVRCPQNLSLEGKLVWFCEPRDVGSDQSREDIPLRVFSK